MTLEQLLEDVDFCTALDTENYTYCYDQLAVDQIPELTKLLISENVNPLLTMKKVPVCYASHTDLTKVDIPNNITGVCHHACAYMHKLENIYLPNSIEKMGRYSFINCSAAKSLKIEKDAPLESIYEACFSDCYCLETIELSDHIKILEDRSFSNCTSFTNIKLPDSLQKIGAASFQNCTDLKEIEIPDSVYSIDASAFEGCTSLEKLHLPNKLVTIPNECFQNCYKLKTLILPKSIEVIGKSAFAGCVALRDIRYNGTIEEWNRITRKSQIWHNVPARVVYCSDGIERLRV